ncbi:MAG: response regulator [Candidatus Omnitrophica bacterium]|nr:response regulator [Candidatus Omnitrophota bacterium]
MAKKILVVDDEPNIIKVVKSRLEANYYEVATATNGEEAVVKALAERPDLILLDVHMPGVDGLEALRRIRSKPETRFTPVIMLTCEDQTDPILAAKDLGVTDYLFKPFEPQKLLDAIKIYI